MACFGFVLQQGVGVPCEPGCSLTRLLQDQLGIDPDYIDARIKTAFLDGKPVDDYDSAIVKDQTTLALSAAMPGLVGATFRSGGILSVFRSGISFQNTDEVVKKETRGKITLKLFNLLVKEMGQGLLEKGILIDMKTLEDAVKKINGPAAFKKIMTNGETITPEQFETMLTKNRTDNINLRIFCK